MFLRLLQAYKTRGLDVHVGNNNLFASGLVKNGSLLETGGGISIADLAFFVGLRHVFAPARIFVVGNAFGYSAFVLAEIFPDAGIDVIDAGIEGTCNQLGNDVTLAISEEIYKNVRLTIGTSPQDVPNAARFSAYDLIFIDGQHSNDAQRNDFIGLLPYADAQSVVYLHDVDMCSMQDSYRAIADIGARCGFCAYSVDFTHFGCKALVRRIPAVEEWLQYLNASPADTLTRPKAHSSVRTTELFVELSQHAEAVGQPPVTLASGKRLTFAEVFEGLARILAPPAS
jgi:predicted O-methyltransferase YrrM